MIAIIDSSLDEARYNSNNYMRHGQKYKYDQLIACLRQYKYIMFSSQYVTVPRKLDCLRWKWRHRVVMYRQFTVNFAPVMRFQPDSGQVITTGVVNTTVLNHIATYTLNMAVSRSLNRKTISCLTYFDQIQSFTSLQANNIHSYSQTVNCPSLITCKIMFFMLHTRRVLW